MDHEDAAALLVVLRDPPLRIRVAKVFDGETLEEARRYAEERPEEAMPQVRAASREAVEPAVDVLGGSAPTR